ncbi:hypothetical protein Cst04h_26220 [Corynebacterium striatum]|uniref:Uncharacterized protein n=1 Tax=Corynebacterium striatum TaxID=43770 RepID=A0ABC9ZRB0_CORST|nr:hypothetical protein Cst04h_17240 [Corynebacterium striatum]GEA44452.1 hypothetical protein Cst04h_26220 [Corynebacterium striatum]
MDYAFKTTFGKYLFDNIGYVTFNKACPGGDGFAIAGAEIVNDRDAVAFFDQNCRANRTYVTGTAGD